MRHTYSRRDVLRLMGAGTTIALVSARRPAQVQLQKLGKKRPALAPSL